MARPKTNVTKAALAATLGLSRGRVSQLIDQGLPVRSDGKVNRAEATAWYQANVHENATKRGPKTAAPSVAALPVEIAPAAEVDSEAGGESLKSAQTRREIALADLREMEAAKMRGELIDLGEVKQALSGLVLSARDRLLVLPAELCDRLAATSDPVACMELLDVRIRRALTDLSRYDPAAQAATQ